MSVYEYLERRFGYLTRAYAASLFILLNIFRMGFILFLAATAIHTMTDWDKRWIIIVSGLVTIAYTVIGGIEAVIWTDVLQSIVLLGGGLLCAGILLFTPEGGPAHVVRIAQDAGKFKLAECSLDLSEPTIVVMLLFGLVTYAANYTMGQDAVQRYLAVPSTREARKGMWLGTCSCVLTWTLFMFIGTLLYSYYTVRPDQLPADVAAAQTRVFPHFVMTRLPPGVVGLILAAMCAAAMSSLDTSVNSMAMVTVHDFYQRWRPGTSDRRRLRLARGATCFWGVLGTVAGLAMIRVEKALDFSYVVASILGGGLFGVFLLALFVRRAHSRGVWIGLAAGVLMTAWGTYDELVIDPAIAQYAALGLAVPRIIRVLDLPAHTLLLTVLANAVSFAVGYIACRVIPDARPRDPAGLTVWDGRNNRSTGEPSCDSL
jgi:SSS family solute:Na+ symporter